MKKIFIIDASGYLFRSYFAIRNMTNGKGESTNALFGFIRSLLKLMKDFNPEHMVAVFDGPNNSKAREELYADYKAHRSSIPGDLGYQIDWARDFCELMGIPHLNIPEVEADDTMGTVAKWGEKQGWTAYLCTSDKDMCQLVNDKILVLNTHKENLLIGKAEVEQTFGVSPDQMIDLLAMIGDASDNVPGISGFGPKTASALLKQFGSLDALLAHPEQIAGKKKQEILIQEKDKALLSRKLVTINISVPIPEDPDFYRLRGPNKTILKEFYSKMGFNSLIREIEETKPSVTETSPALEEQLNYHLVNDRESLSTLIQTLQKETSLCFGTETTHWHPLKAELVGIGFCFKEKEAWYIPVNGNLSVDSVLQALKPIFENNLISFYGHNVKYDLQVLANYEIFIKNISFDTILASYLLSSHSRQHSLDHLSLERFGKIKISVESLTGKGKNEINMRDVPIDKVCTYCCEGIDYTLRLKQLLEKQLDERGLSHLLSGMELPLLRILAKMERNGIYVDIPCLQAISSEITQQIAVLEQEIYTMAGEKFNINSPKQISHILFEKMQISPPKKTATGHSTNAEVLESLKHVPLAKKLLEYRTLEKLRSTYIDALPLEVNPKTHRIHCNFNQTVTATGRLSCQDPNLQNIPIRTEIGRSIRAAFKPQKPRWSYLAADYSQIELRLLAHLSEDPDLINAFQRQEDIHTHTAAYIFNIPVTEVSAQQRYRAKAVNFGIVYGQQAFGLSQELGIPLKDAADLIEVYFAKYQRVRTFIEECRQQARHHGKAVTLTGRERLIPEIHSKNYMIRAAAERLAINTPLQGTAADLIKIAMLRVQNELERHNLKGYMILQIHDELLFEVPDEELDSVQAIVRQGMENVWSLKVPLVVNISIGKNWKEC